MSVKPIRVQLPGGEIYAPALHEAAAKTGARSNLSKRKANALNAMVKASIALLNSGDPSMITLEMRLDDDSIATKIIGKGCGSTTKKLAKQLATAADKKTKTFETKKSASALTISFEI